MKDTITCAVVKKNIASTEEPLWNPWGYIDKTLMCTWCTKDFTWRKSIEKHDYMHLFFCSPECEKARYSVYGRVKTWLHDHIRCPLYRAYYATFFQFQHREKRLPCPSCSRKMQMETDFMQMCQNWDCPDSGFTAHFDVKKGKWVQL